MILIDYSPVIISCAHSAVAWKNGDGKDDYDNVGDAHVFRMWHTIKNINTKFRGGYGEMIFCLDRRPYWRSDVFPNYKKNRKPMDKTIPWDDFFKNAEDILDACKNVFGWKVLDIPNIEADDTIGVLVEKYHADQRIVVVSPDGDFKQLQRYKNVEQFDHIRNKRIIEKDPKVWLKSKIISGDKKDCVPNIRSHVDTFVTPDLRQLPIQRSTKEKWLQSNPAFFCDETMFERYTLNEEMLDLTKIPTPIKEKIIKAYEAAETKKSSSFTYFADHGLSYFVDMLEDFK